MALSEEEKKKMLSAFHEDMKKEEAEEHQDEDAWTDEEKLAIARKILKRMGLDGKYL